MQNRISNLGLIEARRDDFTQQRRRLRRGLRQRRRLRCVAIFRGTIMMYLQPFVTVQVEPNEPTRVQKQTQFAQVTRRLLSI